MYILLIILAVLIAVIAFRYGQGDGLPPTGDDPRDDGDSDGGDGGD